MRSLLCRIILAAISFVLAVQPTTFFAQDSQPQTSPPASAAQPPAVKTPPPESKKYLPLCSTEKVNGDCFVNIDRRYPITMPTFQLRRGAHISVYVFHPFPFESLTLDPGPAQAFEGTDQASGLLNALAPFDKGAVFQTVESDVASRESGQRFLQLNQGLSEIIGTQPQDVDAVKLAKEIQKQLKELDAILTDSLKPVTSYFSETKVIYAEVREIESAAPRPARDFQNSPLRLPGIPATDSHNPWQDYEGWRAYMRDSLEQQGRDTSALLGRLPGPCQKSTDPVPAVGPWLAPARKCDNDAVTTQNSKTPLEIPHHYKKLHDEMEQNLSQLPAGMPTQEIYDAIQVLKTQVEQRHDRIAHAIDLANDFLPALITKFSTDMQSVFTNVLLAHDTVDAPVLVGIISGPDSLNLPPEEKKVLAPYKELAPQITFTLNAQNEIANSLLMLPAASQKQPVVTITALFAAPRFEVSAGTFLSFLSNRSFSNKTDVTINGTVPTPVDVKIDMTKTSGPLVIPFAAANYRISREYDWIAGRRSAFYTTLGVGLNPYNQQVEYVGGFSFSWRYLMFSPLYHLGHGTHLTQGEQVGQTWCQYGAAAGSNPPPCTGGPPSPTTKSYWTGAFALGISVRVPTTFSSSNH